MMDVGRKSVASKCFNGNDNGRFTDWVFALVYSNCSFQVCCRFDVISHPMAPVTICGVIWFGSLILSTILSTLRHDRLRRRGGGETKTPAQSLIANSLLHNARRNMPED